MSPICITEVRCRAVESGPPTGLQSAGIARSARGCLSRSPIGQEWRRPAASLLLLVREPEPRPCPRPAKICIDCLDALGIAHSTTEHAPVFTVAESQSLRDLIPGGHTKNLFLKDKKGACFLVTLEENA